MVISPSFLQVYQRNSTISVGNAPVLSLQPQVGIGNGTIGATGSEDPQ